MYKSPFGFHEGEALIRLAGSYPRLLDILLEEAQNGLDKNARFISITLNKRNRSCAIRDDGEGVTQTEFERALSGVCRTIKKKDKLGRFGIGLISPLGKCEKFTFTSTPKSDPRAYLEWSFVTEDIRAEEEISGFPCHPRKDLQFVRAGGHASKGMEFVTWRTQVMIEGYSSDSQINKVTMESLRDGILDRFGPSMRNNNVVVSVTIVNESGERKTDEIRAKDFTGTKLPEFENQDGPSGRTRFNLYLAKKTDKGRKGKVLVGEIGNDFRFDFATLVRYMPDSIQLSDEVISALKSGFFEGEILNSRVRLNVNRKTFEVDTVFAGFCSAIEKWFQQRGSEHFKEAQEQKQEERYQSLGVRSMSFLSELIKSPAGSALLSAIQSFKKGSIGEGHVEHKGKVSPVTSLAAQGLNKGTGAGSGGGGGEERTPPESEKTSHHPLTAAGPKGSRRVVVRNNSLGLMLMHEAMAGSDKLWVLDEETGTLRINVLHPLWRQLEDHGDKSLMRFQEYIMIQALQLHSAPNEWSEYARLVLDDMNSAYVFMLIHADALTGRLPGGKAKKLNEDKAEEKETTGPRLVKRA